MFTRWLSRRNRPPDINDIPSFYERSIERFGVGGMVEEILRHKSVDIGTNIHHIERAMPGDEAFLKSGYYRSMIARVLYAMEYTDGKAVLDTCCGLGWGSYLVSSNASYVCAVDKDDEVLACCHSLWKAGNIRWVKRDALDLGDLGNKFDVVLAMETIEHFSPAEADRYLSEICRVMGDGGVLMGSSSFPADEADAEELCAINPFHKHVYTQKEMLQLLDRFFGKSRIINGWLFVAEDRRA